MGLTAQALQPEAIAVIAVLGVAVLSLTIVAIALLRSRRRRKAEQARLAADQPDPARFDGSTPAEVIAAADSALYERDGRAVASAAMHLHAIEHGQALPYLLHALRHAPVHQRPTLLAAAAAHGPDELAEHPLLAAALDPGLLDQLRDEVQRGSEPVATGRSGRNGRRRG